MITVSIWHNVARDAAGRPTALLDGYHPGDPMVRVFTFQAATGGRAPEVIAEDAFAAFNCHPASPSAADLTQRYYQRRLRSLSKGDVVAVGEVPLAVGRIGWILVHGGLNEARTDEHGTHPLPAPGTHPAAPGGEAPAGHSQEETFCD